LVPFADVFAQADGAAPLKAVPSFAGKVVIIGATAPSLHDVHSTPLSPMQAGVDSMATAIDNTLNNRHVAELPRWLQALLAVVLCIGIALWVRVHSVASLAPALVLLPASLLGISYLSLNGLPIFIDLNLAAGLGLVFLATLRVWNGWRRQYWSTYDKPTGLVSGLSQQVLPCVSVWSWRSSAPWVDAQLDRLFDAIEEHAPDCRIIAPDVNVSWPATPHWPQLAGLVAIVGPDQQLRAAQGNLTQAIFKITKLGKLQNTALKTVAADASHETLCAMALSDWATMSVHSSEPSQNTPAVGVAP
jgi:CHASE2 domain-containing sensor protein